MSKIVKEDGWNKQLRSNQATMSAVSLLVATICFVISLPLLSGSIMNTFFIPYNGYVYVNRTRTIGNILFLPGALLAIVGVAACIWHLNWILAWVFVGCSIIVILALPLAFPHDSEIETETVEKSETSKEERR